MLILSSEKLGLGDEGKKDDVEDGGDCPARILCSLNRLAMLESSMPPSSGKSVLDMSVGGCSSIN